MLAVCTALLHVQQHAYCLRWLLVRRGETITSGVSARCGETVTLGASACTHVTHNAYSRGLLLVLARCCTRAEELIFDTRDQRIAILTINTAVLTTTRS